MSDSAALVPVPFHAPARPHTGTAGGFAGFSPRLGRNPPAARRERYTAPGLDTDAGLIYNQRGLCLGDPWIGCLVNIWV